MQSRGATHPLLPAGLQLPLASGRLFVNLFAKSFAKAPCALVDHNQTGGRCRRDAKLGAKLQTMFKGVSHFPSV